LCRNVAAEISALADTAAEEIGQEQFRNRGVYICVFEQSILVDNGPNRPWSLLASLSAELLVVSVLVIIPLIYGDHLPDFHWHVVTVGPPVQRAPQPVEQRASSGPTRPAVDHLPRFCDKLPTAQVSQPASSGPIMPDAPPGFIGISGDSAGPGPMLFGERIDIKPPVTHIDKEKVPLGPIHVSSGVQMAKLVKQVIPTYPQLAKITRISGVVHLVGIISKDGTIRNLQVISGHPWLANAALEAVRQWVYRPTLLSGEPVEVICPIDVNFTLSQ